MANVMDLLQQIDYTAVFLLSSTLIVFVIPVFILFPPIPVERSDALRQTHSKLGVPDSQSNLRNQFSRAEHQASTGRPARIQSLHVYPIKSCRGIELSRSRVLPKGLEHDRLYTFAHLREPSAARADEPRAWEFLTQRQLPLLANVKVDLWQPDSNKTSRQLGKMEGSFLVVSFPWTDAGFKGILQRLAAKLSRGLNGVPEKEFILPVEFPSKQEAEARGYEYDKVRIWKDTVLALNMERELPPELSTYIRAKNRLGLFRMDPEKQRLVSRCAPRKDDMGYQPVIDFHDGFPLHLLSLTSIQALDQILKKDENLKNLDIRRFRPNIIASGLEEYDEDDWTLIQCKGSSKEKVCKFDVSCRTVRCKLPNVDPNTGIRHKLEPDHSLRKHRNIDEGAPKSGCMGMQLCPVFARTERPEDLESIVEVGMTIDVLERGSHFAQ